ncbi:MAG: hypothetical protein ACLTZM_21260 [Ruminococcus sp.]
MKKWKKLLLPAMCVFMLQTPVIANAEVAGSSDGAAAVVEDPVAAPTPALLNGIIKKGSKTYYYKDGVMPERTAGVQIRNSTLVKTEWLMQRRRRAVIRKML